MDMLRQMSKILFDINSIQLYGYYSHCNIRYNQLESQQFAVYSSKGRFGLQQKKINLATLKKDSKGMVVA
jgi:hypothetical protein